MNKLDISYEMAQLDTKNRAFYDELTDEERKKFSTYLMLRWGCSLQSGPDELHQYYLQAMNERVNKYFFDINKHPKLQWLLVTTVSPNMGKHRHEWLAFNTRKPKNKRSDIIAKLYPEYKLDDCELMAASIPDLEFKAMLVELGWTDKEIKDAMK